MYNEIIKLCKTTLEVDEYGNELETKPTKREVFAQIRSIRMSEFYAAATADMSPSCVAVLADYRDYEDEEVVLWNDEKYRVLRTYRKGKQLELTLSKKLKDVKNE